MLFEADIILPLHERATDPAKFRKMLNKVLEDNQDLFRERRALAEPVILVIDARPIEELRDSYVDECICQLEDLQDSLGGSAYLTLRAVWAKNQDKDEGARFHERWRLRLEAMNSENPEIVRHPMIQWLSDETELVLRPLLSDKSVMEFGVYINIHSSGAEANDRDLYTGIRKFTEFCTSMGWKPTPGCDVFISLPGVGLSPSFIHAFGNLLADNGERDYYVSGHRAIEISKRFPQVKVFDPEQEGATPVFSGIRQRLLP